MIYLLLVFLGSLILHNLQKIVLLKGECKYSPFLYILLALMFVTDISFASVLQRNKYWATHLCQCRYCNLEGVNLKSFTPGSQRIAKNPLYKNNPYIVRAVKYIADAGWGSCNFQGANLTGANLAYTNFRVAMRGYLTPLATVSFKQANLSKANLKHAILYGDDFSYANVSSANLQYANLSLANFSSADFHGADLRYAKATPDAMHGWGAEFIKTDFTDANLQYAKLGNLSRAILCHTIMPDGKVSNRDCG